MAVNVNKLTGEEGILLLLSLAALKCKQKVFFSTNVCEVEIRDRTPGDDKVCPT